MATAKKATKKVSAKKSTAKKVSAPRKAKPGNLKSFVVYKEPTPFFTFKITDQTVYWTILLLMILGLGYWVLQIQINIADILNKIPVR
jgi:hypothetical protein